MRLIFEYVHYFVLHGIERLFWGQIFVTEILMELHALKVFKYENPIFSGLSECVCV